nr:hypothetical protein Iba_chr02dCG13200 [Ipomoea batatas]
MKVGEWNCHLWPFPNNFRAGLVGTLTHCTHWMAMADGRVSHPVVTFGTRLSSSSRMNE